MSTRSSDWTLARLLAWTQAHFKAKGLQQPRLCAELLLAHALECSKIDLYARFDTVPDTRQLARFRDAVRAAASRQPIAYLIGEKEFYSLPLKVTPEVLIPRSETEVLVDQAIELCRSLEQPVIDVLDLGTGSGCIGLAICRHVPAARVWGSDVSEAALQVAAENARRLNLEQQFFPLQADGLPSGRRYDLLVSNPPYVGSDGRVPLDDDVRRYEPHAALFAGADGLEFYRLISDQAPRVLKPSASILLEIGYGQHDAVDHIMSAAGRFRHVQSWRDRDEGHLRVMHFRYLKSNAPC